MKQDQAHLFALLKLCITTVSIGDLQRLPNASECVLVSLRFRLRRDANDVEQAPVAQFVATTYSRSPVTCETLLSGVVIPWRPPMVSRLEFPAAHRSGFDRERLWSNCCVSCCRLLPPPCVTSTCTPCLTRSRRCPPGRSRRSARRSRRRRSRPLRPVSRHADAQEVRRLMRPV
jgi:hypothetical protein